MRLYMLYLFLIICIDGFRTPENSSCLSQGIARSYLYLLNSLNGLEQWSISTFFFCSLKQSKLQLEPDSIKALDNGGWNRESLH